MDLPTHECTANTLAARDRQLLEIVDAATAEAARLSGEWLACYRGCAVCCFGPFPITAVDGWRLRRGLAELSRSDPASADAIRTAAGTAAAAMADGFPGDAATGHLNLAPEDEGAFAARHAGLPCPVLDPASGACRLYESRPIACRLYGPPLLVDGSPHPHCPLCFKNAPSEAVTRAQTTVEPGNAARAVVDAWEQPGRQHIRTTIAHALADLPSDGIMTE